MLFLLTRALYHLAPLPTLAFPGVVEANVDAASRTVDLGYATYQDWEHPVLGDAVCQSADWYVVHICMRRQSSLTDHQGALRWREPRQPGDVPGIEMADSPPLNCPRGAMGLQPANPFRTQEGSSLPTRYSSPEKRQAVYSEDCLFLK